MKDEITKALGLPDLPPAQYDRARTAILQDNVFYNRALSMLVLGVAAKVIEGMHSIEREALRKRVGFSTLERGKASWGIVENPQTGRMTLSATCAVCKQNMTFMEPKAWSEEIPYDRGGNVKGTTTKWHEPTAADVQAAIQNCAFQHCGTLEKCPPDLLLVWEERLHTVVRMVQPPPPARNPFLD